MKKSQAFKKMGVARMACAGLISLFLAVIPACSSDDPICGEGYDRVPNIASDDFLAGLCEKTEDCGDLQGVECIDNLCQMPCQSDADCSVRSYVCDPYELSGGGTQDVCLSYWGGSINVEERKVVGTDAKHDTLVTAGFMDFSDFRVQDPDRLPFSEACFVYTSQQVTTGDRVPLNIEKVVFNGLSQAVTLLPNENNNIESDLLPQRGFQDDQVTIQVVSGREELDYPAFTTDIPAPAFPELIRVGELSMAELGSAASLGISEQREDPLKVEWTPAGGDYIEIKIVPGSGSSTPYAKLRCITFDDGCLEIPAEALSYMSRDDASNFRFFIERHNHLQIPIEEEGYTVAAAEIDTASILESVVVR